MKLQIILPLLLLISIGLISAGSNCRTTSCGEDCTEEFCCDNSDYVVCGDTEICGPSDAWCDSFLSENPKSCIPDTDICCLDSGNIIDYSTTDCCPLNYPHQEGNFCYDFPKPNSDNFFTRISNCYGDETKCDGLNFLQCEETSPFIHQFQNQGKVIGECNVNCITDDDCPEDRMFDKFCSGKTLKQNKDNFLCEESVEDPTMFEFKLYDKDGNEINPFVPSQDCVGKQSSITLEECDFKCGEIPCNSNICIPERPFGCLPFSCEEGFKECQGDDLIECIDNNLGLIETCEFGCENEECNSKPINISLVIIVIGSMILFGFLIYWRKK